jgi:hypothetical protein
VSRLLDLLTVRTRGGLLVMLVVFAVIGFELRTVIGMLFGVSLPATPYFMAVVGLLALVGIAADILRSSAASRR